MLGAPCPAPSVPEKPPTLPSPSLQVERRRMSGREQGEPWQEDRALPGGVLLSLRAEGSWCPAPPAGRDAAGILSTQLSSSLPWHRRAPSCQTGTRGGRTHTGWFHQLQLSSWLASQPGVAGLLARPRNSPDPEGAKSSPSSWSSSPSRIRSSGALQACLGTLSSEQEREKCIRNPHIWGCRRWKPAPCHPYRRVSTWGVLSKGFNSQADSLPVFLSLFSFFHFHFSSE